VAKILVADDESKLRDVVGEMLSLDGHDVLQAEDGVQALDSIKKNRPDVVLCDIEMPKLKGFDVLTKLRENPALSQIPMIFLTGKTEISYLEEALHLNVNDFLTKPFSRQDLLGAIDLQLKKIKAITM